MAKVTWELEGNILESGENITLAYGTKTQCRKAFTKLTDEQKKKYYFISLQPYSDSERLDFDETLYFQSQQ